MKRLTLIVLIALMFSLVASLSAVRPAAADTPQTYHSDVFGVTFQYPQGWQLREQLPTQTILVASADDLKAIEASKEPGGLVFSLTFSSFRQVGAESVGGFANRLTQIADTPNAVTQPVKVGGADGLSIDTLDGKSGVAGRSLMLSLGRRRVAVVRGIATIRGWAHDNAQQQFESLIGTLSFFPPANAEALDHLGRVLWQTNDPGFGAFADIGATADGSSVLVSDQANGIWTLSANGIVAGVKKYDEIGAYGTLGIFRDGTRYIADPVNHAIWLIQANGIVKKLIGGTVGDSRGAFGPHSPRAFAFGYGNTINILDENADKTRIQVFGRGGDALTAWDIDLIQEGALSTDDNGYVYVVGKNLAGILKISAAGKVVARDLGKSALAGAGLLGVAVDRFGNIYVATADAGVLKLDAEGKLEGVIGDPYDESAPPKPGQIGKPVALALGQNDNILYIADGGKYPQIVAVALSGNAVINLAAGTKSMGTLSYGQTISGEITATAFVQTYTFDGKVGETVTITMRAENAATGSTQNALDAYVDLLSVDGNSRLAANDDAKVPGLGATDAQITSFKLPYNGTYTIRATRFGRETTNVTGDYTLELEKQ